MSRTHEALLRAEAKHEAICSMLNGPLDIEQKLLELKLGKEDLENQNLTELTQSLHSINKCLNEPSIALDIESEESLLRREDILPALIKRKRFVLELMDTMITEKNVVKIRSLLKQVQNRKMQAKIERYLSILYRKNEILKKEYRSIENLDAQLPVTITENTKNIDTSPVYEDQAADRNKAAQSAPKSSSRHGFLSIIITAALLAFLGTSITVAHFLNFTVPAVQEYAFLVTLGFLMGIMFRISQKGNSEKKNETISG
jgi:hypothetical protein